MAHLSTTMRINFVGHITARAVARQTGQVKKMEILIEIPKKAFDKYQEKWMEKYRTRAEENGDTEENDLLGFDININIKEEEQEFSDGLLSTYGGSVGYDEELWASVDQRLDMDIYTDVIAHIVKILNKTKSALESFF